MSTESTAQNPNGILVVDSAVAASSNTTASALPDGPPTRGPASTILSGSPLSTRPKQTVHHNEPKGNKTHSFHSYNNVVYCFHESGSSNYSLSLTGRRVTHHQAPTSSMRIPSASSSSNSLSSSSRPPVHSSSGGIGSGSVNSSMVRSRSHGTNGASGASGSSAGAPGGLLRKPVRPQTSHPPPPPSSH